MGSDLQSRLSSVWTFAEIQQRIDFELFHLVSKIGKREVGSRLWSAEGEWWKTVPEKTTRISLYDLHSWTLCLLALRRWWYL